MEGHYGQIGGVYLFDMDFQKAYLEKGVSCFVDILDKVHSASQITKDVRALYGALLSACQSGVGRRILMENTAKQDGIRSWCQLIKQYQTDENKNVRIKKLENVINTVFHRHYKGGVTKWIQDYEDALTELVILGQKAWDDDDIKKRRPIQNPQNVGLVDTVFEELVSGKSFGETCDFFRSHAIRHDQQNKEKAASQIHNTNQLNGNNKKDAVKKVLALFYDLKSQASNDLDDDFSQLTGTKTVMVCKLAQIHPDIWMTLPLEAQKVVAK